MRIVGAFLLMLAACENDNRPDQWDAYIYPDLENERREEIIRGFKTFELCQAAALDRIREVDAEGGGSYECGYKCGPMEKYGGMNVCEETRK